MDSSIRDMKFKRDTQWILIFSVLLLWKGAQSPTQSIFKGVLWSRQRGACKFSQRDLIHCWEVAEPGDESTDEQLSETMLILELSVLAILSKAEREKLKMCSNQIAIGKLFFVDVSGMKSSPLLSMWPCWNWRQHESLFPQWNPNACCGNGCGPTCEESLWLARREFLFLAATRWLFLTVFLFFT